LIAYVVALALLAILGIALWNRLPAAVTEPAPESVWSLASRSAPGFAVSQHDSNDKTETYEIFRHSAAARMSFAGPMPTAGPWQSSKSIVPAPS
jgi:hypothetical protein